MAKKSKSQGIGYIPNADALGELTRQLISFLNASANTDNSLGEEFINKLKSYVDAYVGRSRTNFTKTDVYQVLYLLLYSPIVRVTGEQNRVFKETMVNTVVAKLVTEGQYGNPSVVRRQTTEDKIREMLMRTIGYQPSMLQNSNRLISRFGLNSSQDEFPILMRVARKFLQRGTRSTTTTRRSNRTRRTTTPRATTTTPSTQDPTSTQRYVVTDSGIIPAPRTSSSVASYPGQVHTENEFNELVTYINSINATTTEERKKKIFLCVPLFKYLLKKKFDAVPRSIYSIQTLTNSDINNIFQSLYQKVNNLDLWISFAFLLYGFRTVNTKRVISPLINLLPRNQRDMDGLNAISKKFGMGDRTFVKKILAHLQKDRTFTGPSSVVNYMVNGSNAGRSPFSNFIAGAYRSDEGYVAFALLYPNFVTSYEADTTPTATVTDRTPPGFGPDVTQESFRQTQATPTPTPPAPTPPPAPDVLIRNMKITDAFDFGIEWEHFGLGFPKLKRTMAAIGQPLYPEYYPYHDLSDYIKKGMFPDGKINKGWWVMQVDGSLSADYNEPASEFRNTKQEAMVRPRDAWRDHNTYKGELVSPVLGGKRGLAIIKLVGNALVNAGMRHNPTMGMHTHVTKKGFNRTNIKKLMYNYTVMEPLIESMMEPNRRSTAPRQYNKSNFDKIGLTLRSSQSTVIEKCKSQILNLSDDDFYYKWGSSKKQAVNLLPFYGGNTIEFRQQGANFEADSVTMWIAFLFYLCEFSKTKTFKECQWNNLIAIMPVGLASFWYNRIQDLTGKSPYELSFQKN